MVEGDYGVGGAAKRKSLGARSEIKARIERIEGRELVGWLINESDLSERISFSLHVNGQDFGRHVADLPRKLLRNRGYEDWNHGYRIDIGSVVRGGGKIAIKLRLDRDDAVFGKTFDLGDAEEPEGAVELAPNETDNGQGVSELVAPLAPPSIVADGLDDVLKRAVEARLPAFYEKADLARDERKALCLLFVNRPPSADEMQLTRGDFLAQILHSRSFRKTLAAVVDSGSAPQDLVRGRPPAPLRDAVARVLGLDAAGSAALATAATWTETLMIALGTPEVRSILVSAGPARRGAYLVDYVRLCEHLLSDPRGRFDLSVRESGEHLVVLIKRFFSEPGTARLEIAGGTHAPIRVERDVGGLRIVFALPADLDDGRSHYARVTFGEEGMRTFPTVPMRLRRGVARARAAQSPMTAQEPAQPASRGPVRAGAALLTLDRDVRLFLGEQELAISGTGGGLTAWSLQRLDADDAHPVRVVNPAGDEIWSGTLADIASDPRLDEARAGVRIRIDRLRATLALLPGELVAGVRIDDQLLDMTPLLASADGSGIVRDFVVELPVPFLDGAEHVLAFTAVDGTEERLFVQSFRIEPTLDQWAELLLARNAIRTTVALVSSGRSEVVEEVVRYRGDTLPEELLTDVLLSAVVATREGAVPPSIRDSLSVLWYRASKQPQGLERFIRRLLATVPAVANATEWRVIAQQPLKDALTDIALYLRQIGGNAVVGEAFRALVRLERYGLALETLNGAAVESAENDRLRLRALRWRGETEAAVALATDLKSHKDRSIDSRRILVDHMIENGNYLAAAAMSTGGLGVTQVLAPKSSDQRVARDTFPLRWTDWAKDAFAGAESDAEAALGALARIESLPSGETISIFFTNRDVDLLMSRACYTTLDPRPSLALLAPDQTCGSLPVFTDWAVVVHGAAKVSPARLSTALRLRIATEDLLLINVTDGPDRVAPHAFAVRAAHLAFVADLRPLEGAVALGASLRHRTVLIAGE